MLDFKKLLRYNIYLYISRDKVLKEELINKYYNNLLFKYFNTIKIYKLFIYKYY